ncbi:uncharacterized protein RHOBADRAFT_53189 [Rhodotorula graminis WP1]|uniref:Uncharacterized protein n=1 Tax=Rhodotorula graminis (strain WP1) TaxID=578459 RepID=A0A194S3S4_RHOGW|nr:uncharacterized protein RHOBADRAFT_53189 [Rhodotorula graminis WP1]KPV75174.1 hypothetical protein RHOBADRAFT_53189 [Rhodotorula graminis WP1]
MAERASLSAPSTAALASAASNPVAAPSTSRRDNGTSSAARHAPLAGLEMQLGTVRVAVSAVQTGALGELTLEAHASLATGRVLAAATKSTSAAVRSTDRPRTESSRTTTATTNSTRIITAPSSTSPSTATGSAAASPPSSSTVDSPPTLASSNDTSSTSARRPTSTGHGAASSSTTLTLSHSRPLSFMPSSTSPSTPTSASATPDRPDSTASTSPPHKPAPSSTERSTSAAGSAASPSRERSSAKTPTSTTRVPTSRRPSASRSSATRSVVEAGDSSRSPSSSAGGAAAGPASSAKPSPTRYGSAPTKGCVAPPSTFEGTDAGFAQLCSVRYCDAAPRRNMAWSGNAGNVTRLEIETALGMLRELEPLWENGQGNVLSDGWLGQGMHDAGLLFEVTGDRRALDVMVQIADNILALQNANTPNPVTIWTGSKDSVWPTGNLYPADGKLVYAGCEQGAIVGNMVAAAVYILKTPCLWAMVPPVFAGPTIFKPSTTYYERAKAYVAAGDDTYESFFWRFSDSNLNLINPADERWWSTGDTRAPGSPMPWNRGMMMMHGYLRLAAAHETDAAFDANLTAYYDAISRSHISNFVKDLNQTKAIRNGVTTFEWDYSFGEDHTEESQGVHAYYDIWGSWIGWQRNSAVFGLSNFIGTTFAQTFQSTISFGNGSFSGLVTGSSSTKAYTINRLYGGWSFYALWLPEWFDTIATANVEAGFSGRTWLAIPLLWTKHALAVNDVTFWSGRFSSGFGAIVGTEANAASSSSGTGASYSAAVASQPSLAALALVVAVVLALEAVSPWA